MKGKDKTKEQLINELEQIRQRVAELEILETERKQTEEALHLQSEIVAHAAEGVHLVRAKDGVIIFANPRFHEMFGYSPGELVGKRVSVLNAPGEPTPEEVAQEIIRSLEKNGRWRGEVHNIRKDGTRFWCRGNVTPFEHSVYGKVWVTVQEDITESKKAEEEIAKTREFLDRILNGIYESVMVITPDYRIVDVNSCFLNYYGVDREETIGHMCYEITHRLSHPCSELDCACPLQTVIDTKSPNEVQHIHKDRSGKDMIVEINSFPIPTPTGEIEYIVEVQRDITERKQAEEKLRESEEQYYDILENANDLIQSVDVDGRLLYANRAWRETLGYAQEEISELSFLDIIHPESQAHCMEIFQQVISGGSVEGVEATFVTKGGKKVMVEGNVNCKSVDGKPTATRGIFRNITERKQTEEELQKERNRAQKYLDVARVMLVALGTDQKVSLINRKGCEVLGYKEDEIIGKNWFDNFLAEKVRNEVKTVFDKLVAGETEPVEYFENPVLTKSGKERIVAWHNTILTDEQGNVIGTLSSGEDITERKQVAEQLQHSQLLASLGEMTAGIAHEVGNPIASIVLYSELVLKSNIPRQDRKDLRVIHNEAKRAGKLIRELLTYSRRTTPHMRRLDLHRIFKQVLKMRRYGETVQNITVSTNLLKGPLYIQGDASQLTQVFLNLVLNAEEALQEHKGGNIKVATQVDGEWAKVSIADDGTGIPAEHLSQVFHPFFSTKKVGKGTGLGLSTCYGIVTDHGGLIRAENNEMGGATFTVELPLIKKMRQGRLSLEM